MAESQMKQSSKSYDLQKFTLVRVLNEDPQTHTISLLGTLPYTESDIYESAIVRIEQLGLSTSFATAFPSIVDTLKLVESTDIYSWVLGWTKPSDASPDIKINVIFPATEVHIRKYSKQHFLLFQETPEIYRDVVKPFINAFPPARTQWVENILSGVSETSKILHNDLDPTLGFILLPDMKWDSLNISTLYLIAIARALEIRSLRDLHRGHVQLLKNIKAEAERVAEEKWGISKGGLRFYVHYQPSYYRFHVHIVNVNFVGLFGMSVGHAHLLEDLISLIELGPTDGSTILERMTITYALGEQHGLFARLREIQLQK